MATTNETNKPEQPERPPQPSEAQLLLLMAELCKKLQDLDVGNRRRVLTSVATMLGVATSSSQRSGQQQQQSRNGGR